MSGDHPIFHIRISPGQIGSSLAHMWGSQQADAIKAFCAELRSVCGTEFNAQLQLHHVASCLSESDRDLLMCLGLAERDA